MNIALNSKLGQRADYTHKPNLKTGRHGWLRLTPAYGVKVVEQIIEGFERPMTVLDPFCGTATTALSAAYNGHTGITTDINPFLVWFGKAKTDNYSGRAVADAREACRAAIELVKTRSINPVEAPPIHNIERWWSAPALRFLCDLRAAIECVTEPNSQSRNLLMVAFCRTLIATSNAAFNHQSMSFKDADSSQHTFDLGHDFTHAFYADFLFVLSGAESNPDGDAEVLLADARNIAESIERKVDCVITSPPYANRMSYIRELRPYMYWLGFLTSGKQAGELDWTAIGGTWGLATSRLNDWVPENSNFESSELLKAVDGIAHADNKNGFVLSQYVSKYFDDMWSHFNNLTPRLAPDAEMHYIVGNSTFYGNLLSVELVYAEMLSRLGFVGIECRPIRKRNSKKELVEFDVVATWPGRN